MASSAKVPSLDNHGQNGDWIIVSHCQGRRRTRWPGKKPVKQPLILADTGTDAERELKVLQKLEICMKNLEKSEFYASFLEQMQTPEVLSCFQKVLGSESKVQMVIYGIGSIESYENPRFQLSLSVLMKRRFDWIGNIEVFDPVLSTIDSRVLESLDCSILSINEEGRRKVEKPTLFFMPHCEAELYNNLLQANWNVEALNRIILFGNSFETYEHIAGLKGSSITASVLNLLTVRNCTKEFRIKTDSDDYFAAFHDSSWHFFSPNQESELIL